MEPDAVGFHPSAHQIRAESTWVLGRALLTLSIKPSASPLLGMTRCIQSPHMDDTHCGAAEGKLRCQWFSSRDLSSHRPSIPWWSLEPKAARLLPGRMSCSQLLGVGGSKAGSVVCLPSKCSEILSVPGSQMVLRIALRGEEGVK